MTLYSIQDYGSFAKNMGKILVKTKLLISLQRSQKFTAE